MASAILKKERERERKLTVASVIERVKFCKLCSWNILFWKEGWECGLPQILTLKLKIKFKLSNTYGTLTMNEIKSHLGNLKNLGLDDCCNWTLNIDLSILIFESKNNLFYYYENYYYENRFYSSFDLIKGNMLVHVEEEAFQYS